MKSAGLLFFSFLMVGCVTNRQALKLNESDGRIGFDDTRVSERRATIMERVASRFTTDVECTSVKTGMTNSRKAISLEECKVPLSSGQLAYAGQPIQELHYRFIEDRLLQMEMVFSTDDTSTSEADVAAAVAAQLDAELGLERVSAPATTKPTASSGAELSAAVRAYISWSGAKDLVELMTDSRTRLKISDARLVRTVIALKASEG